jgi:hypothetical protein
VLLEALRHSDGGRAAENLCGVVWVGHEEAVAVEARDLEGKIHRVDTKFAR